MMMRSWPSFHSPRVRVPRVLVPGYYRRMQFCRRGATWGSARVLGLTCPLGASVEDEVKAAVGHWPGIQAVFDDGWFPPSFAADRDGEPERVETFRQVRLFGDPEKPREHLGESETFVLIHGRADLRGSTFVTDDHDAFRVVEKFGVRVKDTVDVLAHLVGWSTITATEAYDITVEMESRGRELRRLPRSPEEFL